MTDRNNAPAGRLVPTGEKPTETGRPMLQIAEEQDSHKGKGLGRAAAARVPDSGRVRRTDRRVPQDGAAHVPDGNAARHQGGPQALAH